MRARALGVALVVTAVAVLAVLALTHGPDPSVEQQTRQLAGQLRCPTCGGESVAQSDAPMARSMRSEVAAQLRSGRSADEVRAWFRDRYGDDVVLAPSRDGVGWLLWLVPPAALVAGLSVVMVRRRRPSATGTRSGRPEPLGARTLTATAVVVLAVGAAVPALAARDRPTNPDSAAAASPAAADPSAADPDPATVAQRLDDAGRFADALGAWRRASRAHPDSDAVRTRLAFDLLRTGHAARVPPFVRPLARTEGSGRAFALLVLGLAQRDLGRPTADATLRAFLRADPDHPAAAQVRRLLAGR